MRVEALKEMIAVAEFCINYRKELKVWGSLGCYGYPAAILLLAIVDSIGSVIVGGSNVKKHFEVLNHQNYYNLGLDDSELRTIYKDYRCLLMHNSVMEIEANLSLGEADGSIFEFIDGCPQLNLKPFLDLTNRVLDKFLKEQRDEIMLSNKFL